MENSKTLALFETESVKQQFQKLMGKRASVFLTSVNSVVKANSMLKDADPQSVMDSVMTAVALDLPINPSLGMAFIVPYKTKVKDEKGNDIFVVKASFQIGYKGLKQLALRSGQIAKMADVAVKEGQLIENDPLTGPTFSRSSKISEKVIGYVFYVKLLDGYEKALYMTVDELKDHGKKYSKSFEKGKWTDDFDAMARKTVIRLLLTSGDIPLSVDIRNALSEENMKPQDMPSKPREEAINPEDTTEEDLYSTDPEPMSYEDYVVYLLSFLPDGFVAEGFEGGPSEDQADDYVKTLQVEIGRRCIKDKTIMLDKEEIINIFIGEDKQVVAMKKEALSLLKKDSKDAQ